MISILILFGTLAATVVIMWWRIISNIAEVIHIWRLKARRGRRYAEGAWGARQRSLMALLVSEILVAMIISALIVLMLTGTSFY